MARNDGVDRISARNVNLSSGKIGNTQRHNEREKESYTNPDIVPERSDFNIHFKIPADDYEKMFAQMETDKVISTRGLKDDANLYGELIFDVNSAYFHNPAVMNSPNSSMPTRIRQPWRSSAVSSTSYQPLCMPTNETGLCPRH